MSLTTEDLNKIAKLFDERFLVNFEQVIVPYVDTKIEELRLELKAEIHELRIEVHHLRFDMDQVQREVKELGTDMKELRTDMNDHVVTLHDRCDEITGLIGSYFEDCASKTDHITLKKRVDRLELSRT